MSWLSKALGAVGGAVKKVAAPITGAIGGLLSGGPVGAIGGLISGIKGGAERVGTALGGLQSAAEQVSQAAGAAPYEVAQAQQAAYQNSMQAAGMDDPLRRWFPVIALGVGIYFITSDRPRLR
jgi:hypothetical protein